ncbi:methyl-accepting chemotaxis protein [Phaeospirillum tilakii]|uniref:Methyl-accepting chemotaxis protein n=1 Tax=Phaeospirillum tilakii TaxID=741673 RepID=A0ABW5CA25_9PROT
MHEIDRIRATAAQALTIFLWLHVPLLAVTGALLGQNWGLMTAGAVVLAGAATLVRRLDDTGEACRSTIAVALMGMVALMVYAFEGHPWQIDIHMYFFAAVAMLVAFCDWKTLAIAAVMVALHHLVLNVAYPAAVFPGGGSFGRVVLHAVILVAQTVVLGWVAWRLNRAFAQVATALGQAEEARTAVAAAAAERERLALDSQGHLREERLTLARQVRTAVGEIADGLSTTADAARQSAQDVDRRMTEIFTQISAANASIGDVRVNVETMAATTDTLSRGLKDVDHSVRTSRGMAETAVTEIERTNATVESLAGAADRIGNVVTLISDIASQTNLLALNATIEAARAGDAGKGFAVVAGEVKSLANQTARATEDIGTQVAEIQSATSGAVAAIREIGRIIAEIEQAIGAIAHSTDAQGEAIGEILHNARNATGGVETAGGSVERLTALARDLGTVAQKRTQLSMRLSEQAGGLAEQIHQFVARIEQESPIAAASA